MCKQGVGRECLRDGHCYQATEFQCLTLIQEMSSFGKYMGYTLRKPLQKGYNCYDKLHQTR